MTVTPDETIGAPRPRGGRGFWLAAGVLGLILLVAIAAVVAAGLLLRAGHPNTAQTVLGSVSLMIVAVAAIGVGLFVLWMVRQLEALSGRAAAIEQRTAVIAEQAVALAQSPPTGAYNGPSAAEMRALLLELRETMLLPEEERARRFENLVEREIQRGIMMAERYIASRDFHHARQELIALTDRFGEDIRLQPAKERLERAAEAARASDIQAVTQRVEDLMALGRWDEAERLSRELLDKYPISQEAAGLLIRVQRERKLYEQRNRQRLFDEIQSFVTQRRWQDAARAARQFIENFPTGPDTDALRTQLETLDANADIQIRQQLEQQLKDLIRQQHYWDAVALARRILQEHPLSPQANVLRSQIGRLEELARRQVPTPPPQAAASETTPVQAAPATSG